MATGTTIESIFQLKMFCKPNKIRRINWCVTKLVDPTKHYFSFVDGSLFPLFRYQYSIGKFFFKDLDVEYHLCYLISNM